MGAREGIEKTNRTLEKLLQEGDASGLAGLYTDDGRVMPPGAPAIEGRAGIEAFWKEGIAAGMKSLSLTTIAVSDAGDTAAEVGRATVQMGDASADGKYIVLWRNEGGDWKLAADIWNLDA